MNITQLFYNMAAQYDKLFLDWHTATQEQAAFLNRVFQDCVFDLTARILDCACGIGTQAIGLALLGYNVTASDISDAELAEAEKRGQTAVYASGFLRFVGSLHRSVRYYHSYG